MWYVSALVYVGLAVALLMIKVDFMSKKIEDKDVEIEKYNKRIEEIIKSSPFPIIISRLSDDQADSGQQQCRQTVRYPTLRTGPLSAEGLFCRRRKPPSAQ